MPNHIHLLVNPEQTDSISRMTRLVGSRYAQFINRKYRRTGTLREGRHKSSPVDTETYLLKCYRYIEINPVRAMMVSRPEEYPWSSCATNAMGIDNELVSPHQAYQCLGTSKEERCIAYGEIVNQALDNQSVEAIRRAAFYCYPLGDQRFRQEIETTLGVPLGQQCRGRPRKGVGTPEK